MALELHGRNELYRYKNEMWKKNREDKGYLQMLKFSKNGNVTFTKEEYDKIVASIECINKKLNDIIEGEKKGK